MSPPEIHQLSIAAWSSICKVELARACEAFPDLAEPSNLGEHWPAFMETDRALAFFDTHESYALTHDKGKLVGGFGLRFETESTAWFYYFILPENRGLGLGKFAILKAAELALNHGATSLMAKCDETNEASMHALISSGFATHAFDAESLTIRILKKNLIQHKTTKLKKPKD